MGYDATQVIIKAIESLQKQSKEITPQTLREAIKFICLEPTETSGDALWFNKDGNSNRDDRLVQWENDKNKGWTFKLLKKPSPSTHQSCPKPKP